MEYERVRQSAKAVIKNLLNSLDVGYRKQTVLNKKIELAKNRLDIAKYRFDDGQISEVKYLEAKVFYLEAKNNYLEEFKQYMLDRIDLNSQFAI